MKANLIYAIVIGLLVLLIGGCGQSSPSATTPTSTPAVATVTVGEAIQIQGTVVDTINECIVDGICAHVVDTDTEQYTVIWAPGMIPCEGQVEPEIAVGDTVDVYAEVQAADTLSVCTAQDYFIRKTSE